MEFTLPFIISQLLMICAMFTDFFSFQFKDRKKTVIFLAISCILIWLHYFFLWKLSAWIITSISAIRYITTYFTTNKKVLILFIICNTIVLFLTYKESIDLLFYAWTTIWIIWSFQDQKHNKLMRLLMMCWTINIIIYNTLIFSPMAIATEVLFLSSNIIWYYRFYIKKIMNDKVIVKASEINWKWIFAIKNIKKWEIVIKWDISKIITEEEINEENKNYLYPIEWETWKYILMHWIQWYMNHSTNPNTYVENYSDIALRDIEVGEEITSDYSDML